jgi:XRE family transcriptional regulator, fatty acid utilization regulator
MEVSTETLRLLLGLKLKALRQDRGASLKEVAERAGVSISYLSEIEKGKKYPKPAKLLDLARALGVSFDDLVSQRVEEGLAPLKDAIRSPFLQEFPFHLFGIEPEDLLALVAGAPEKTAGLVRVLDEVARDYDMRVKHFLFAALRAYQLLHRNHFPDFEAGAGAYRQRRGWPEMPPPTADALREILEREHGYRIDAETLPTHPELHGLRSVYRAAEARGNGHPELLVNGRLLPEQLAFLYAREIGFLELGLAERPATSSWVRVQRFEPVFNNFCASYFAGSLLVAEEALRAALGALFAQERWDAAALGALLVRHRTTPEMFFYRVAQLVPAHFGLADLYFMRFTRRAGEEHAHLTKVLNMSRVPLPHGLRRELDYEKRWAAIGGVRALTAHELNGPVISAQRSHFAGSGEIFFEITLSRSLSLGGGASSVTLGFLMTDGFRQRVRFAGDPAVPDVEVVYDAGPDRHRGRVDALAALGVRLD